MAGVVSAYGATVKPKLANAAIGGAPEDQLRGPLEVLWRDFAEIGGLPAGAVRLVGETALADLKTRPDFAVTVSNALVGFIEVKAPGKGADPRKFNDPHDKEQWDKLKSLPNLIYTDGNSFSLWRDGKLEGAIVRLEGDVETSGAKLAAPRRCCRSSVTSCAGHRFRRRPQSSSLKSVHASAACCAMKSSSRWRAAVPP
jgi:hypothetical protein